MRTDMPTVYVLTAGCYSDYHIVGVYSTRALAERASVLDALCRIANIEEWKLDPHIEAPTGMLSYEVVITASGESCVSRIGASAMAERSRNWEPYSPTDGTLAFTMWARDEQHAAKIAMERKARLTAMGLASITWDEWRRRLWAGDPTLPLRI